MNFSRVQWRHELVEGAYRRIPETREDNWVWSKQDAIDMHRPQYWGRVQFSEAPPGTVAYEPGDDEHARTQMRRIHAAVETWRSAHGQWPASMEDLDGLWEPVMDASLSEPSLETGDEGPGCPL